jgi:crotonobetaine/carnitine-CoA ligase
MVPPALGRDVRWLVDHWARQAPDRPFLVWAPFDEEPLTWSRREYAEAVARLAGGLRRRGLAPGDRVALVLPNGPEFLLVWTAAAVAGAAAVCLNPRASRDELGYALDHSGATVVVTSEDRAGDVAAVTRARLLLATGPDADAVPALLREDPLPAAPPVPWDAAASIQYTSGTTARPKAVVWSQANCLWAGQVGAAHQRLGPADVNLVHLPLFHTNALSYSFLSSLWSGGTVVLQPRFSASRFWPTAVAHGATWTSVVSFCLRALADRPVPDEHRFRGWANSAVLDAAPVTGGVPVMGWFGMTETVSHPLVSDPLLGGDAGSMGRAAPEYAVRLVDEAGTVLGPGETGELQVLGRAGVSLFKEYLHAPEQTAAAFTPDGWFRTGDRVRLDEAGTWWFVERDKDVLKVGGENVGAPEIERVLLGVPGVREVAVVGRPDPMLGEVPVAFVLPADPGGIAPGPLEAACERELTPYKRPREIRVVDELPRSTLDKVAKAALRELLRQEVGADA